MGEALGKGVVQTAETRIKAKPEREGTIRGPGFHAVITHKKENRDDHHSNRQFQAPLRAYQRKFPLLLGRNAAIDQHRSCRTKRNSPGKAPDPAIPAEEMLTQLSNSKSSRRGGHNRHSQAKPPVKTTRKPPPELAEDRTNRA